MSKSHFFLSKYPRKSKAYQRRKKNHKLSKCHAHEIHKRVTVLCMQSQDCKRLLGGCQHSLPDGILVITLVFKVSSLSSFWPSHVHYFVITLALILSSLSSKDCWVVANIVCQMATQLNHPCHHFGQHIVITFGPHIATLVTTLVSIFS